MKSKLKSRLDLDVFSNKYVWEDEVYLRENYPEQFLLKQLLSDPDFDGLDFPDIRNKLSPVTTLISLFERGEYEYMKEVLPQVKESINYLVGRDIYDVNN